MSFLSDVGIGGLIGVGIAALVAGPVGAAAGLSAGTGITATGAALGAVGGASLGAQKHSAGLAADQGEEMKKQATIKSAIAGLRASRERSEMLRRSRIIKGQIEAAAAETSTEQSSGVVGGIAGLQATTASNIGFSLDASRAGRDLFASGNKILDLEKKKGRSDLVAGAGSTLFDIGLSSARGEFSP